MRLRVIADDPKDSGLERDPAAGALRQASRVRRNRLQERPRCSQWYRATMNRNSRTSAVSSVF